MTIPGIEQHSQTLADKVDELGALELELHPLRGKIKREADLRKELRAIVADSSPSDEYCVSGTTHDALLGACGWERTIVSKSKLIRALSIKVWRECSTVTLAVVDRFLTPEQQVGIVEKLQTGARPLTLAAKEPLTKERAA